MERNRQRRVVSRWLACGTLAIGVGLAVSIAGCSHRKANVYSTRPAQLRDDDIHVRAPFVDVRVPRDREPDLDDD